MMSRTAPHGNRRYALSYEEMVRLWISVQQTNEKEFTPLGQRVPLLELYDNMNNTVWHCAAATRNPDNLIMVLKHRESTPPINAINSFGYTALQMALMGDSNRHSNEDLRLTVSLLLEAGADPRLPLHSTDNGIATANKVKCKLTINLLYRFLAAIEPKSSLFWRFINADWSLGHFIWTEDLELLQQYVDYVLSIPSNMQSIHHKRDICALHQAVDEGASIRTFEILDNYNLDPNHYDPATGDTPLHRACALAGKYVNHEVVEKLLAWGASPNLRNRKCQNCLHLAAKTGSDLVVNLLLKLNVETDVWDLDGKNPIHYAAIGGSKAVIHALHDVGLSIHDRCRSSDGAAALHLASYYCHSEAVAHLIKLGANPNEQDLDGKTPLYYAVMLDKNSLRDQERCRTTVDFLIEKGANLNLNDNNRNDNLLTLCLQPQLKLHNARVIIRSLALVPPRDPKILEHYMSEMKDQPKLQEIYDGCLNEIEASKKYKFSLNNWASVHTILTAPENVIRPLMRNPDVVKSMYRYIIDRVIYEYFPIYSSTIIEKFNRYELEERRICFALEGLRDVFSKLDPRGIVADSVITYMGEEIDALVQHKIELTNKYLVER